MELPLTNDWHYYECSALAIIIFGIRLGVIKHQNEKNSLIQIDTFICSGFDKTLCINSLPSSSTLSKQPNVSNLQSHRT